MNKLKLGNNVRLGEDELIGYLFLRYYPVKSIWKGLNESLYFGETCSRLFIDVEGDEVMRAMLNISWYTSFKSNSADHRVVGISHYAVSIL